MSAQRVVSGMVGKMVAGASASALLLACGSYDTGSGNDAAAEQACLDVIGAFAHAAERCGGDYATEHDRYIKRDANGDCKNVRSIRDENALRSRCIPFVTSQPCADFTNGKVDPTCAEQLQRPL